MKRETAVNLHIICIPGTGRLFENTVVAQNFRAFLQKTQICCVIFLFRSRRRSMSTFLFVKVPDLHTAIYEKYFSPFDIGCKPDQCNWYWLLICYHLTAWLKATITRRAFFLTERPFTSYFYCSRNPYQWHFLLNQLGFAAFIMRLQLIWLQLVLLFLFKGTVVSVA